jgi:hypothetical protein
MNKTKDLYHTKSQQPLHTTNTKRHIFGGIYSPVILEFHLVFYVFFRFFIFLKKFKFKFQNSPILKFEPGRFRCISSTKFDKFVNLLSHGTPYSDQYISSPVGKLHFPCQKKAASCRPLLKSTSIFCVVLGLGPRIRYSIRNRTCMSLLEPRIRINISV